MTPTIALIAHDRKKDDIVDFVKRHNGLFSRYRLVATGTTGQRIKAGANLEVECFLSGSFGGDAQIAAQVVTGYVVAVIFLLDPLYAQPHEPDIRALLRLCEVHNVPIATNLATAEMVVESLKRTQIAHLIFNPVSGQGDADQALTLIRQMLEPHLHLRIYTTTEDIGAEHLAQQAIDEEADMVIVSGGDGTISAVAGVLVGTGIPLGLIPRGTANAFCSALGIPTTITPIRSACQIIIEGKTRYVDTALCNGTPMILLAGVGYEAETIERATRELKDQWGALAYIIAGWQQLGEQQLFETEIEIEGTTYSFEAGAITIANAAPPTSVLAQGAGEVVFDDGLLDITIVTSNQESRPLVARMRALTGMISLLGAALVKTTPNSPDFYHFRSQRLTLKTNPPQKVVIDGEVTNITDVEIECIPNSLSVIAPAIRGAVSTPANA
jgi:diacylglycerol kinase (ATP)